MSRPDRQGFLDRVDRVVHGLRASGISESHLRWGVLVVMEKGYPLRDSIVLREARRRAAMETNEARAVWEDALQRLRMVLPESTMGLWIDPLELVGEDDHLLVLAAPTGIKAWTERRYAALLGEAVRGVGAFAGVRFASIALPMPMREVYAR